MKYSTAGRGRTVKYDLIGRPVEQARFNGMRVTGRLPES